MISRRAAPNVRRFLGTRIRALRAEHGLTQTMLGRESGLTATFIGQVERGQKSISIDSLYRVSNALKVPLRWLTDVPPGSQAPQPDAERVFALIASASQDTDLGRAYRKLAAVLSNGRHNGRHHGRTNGRHNGRATNGANGRGRRAPAGRSR
jgi:transcriptional regulator with XRE-family HTH domain